MSTTARSHSRRDTTLLVACVALSLIAQGLPEQIRAPFAGALRRTIVAPLLLLQRNAEMWRRTWQTQEERTLARDSLALRVMALDAVQNENQRLRRLLGLGSALKWGFVPAEVLQGRRGVGGAEEYTVTLTAGFRAGVRPFSAIVAPEGLVGMVRTVDPGLSIGIMWAHPDFRVSAMAADGSAFGIAAAHLGDEPERYLLEMRGVPFRSTLRAGTPIVSSGLGGVFPRGIPIGTVLAELKTSEVWARTYLLRPSVLPADIGSVMVLQPQRASAGVEGIWAGGEAADSAARKIAAAGDSVAQSTAAGSAIWPLPGAKIQRRDTTAARTTRRARLPEARSDSARRPGERGDTVPEFVP